MATAREDRSARVRGDERLGYEALVQAVAEEGHFPTESAERYLVAVIATLEARLSISEVSDLEAELPAILREILHREPIFDLPSMDEKELLARVRSRLQVTREEAERIARVVLRTLSASLSPWEAANIEEDLTPSLRNLWRDH